MSTISASTTSTTALVYTADTTGTLVLQTGATPTTAVYIDTAQNVGVGVTPSAWGSNYKVIQTTAGTLSNYTTIAVGLHQNSYDSAAGSFKYITSNYATRYNQEAGVHSWYNAPSGTAGNAITFTQAMTLTAAGNLGINTTSPNVSGQGTDTKVVTISGSSNFWGGVELNNPNTSGGSLLGFIGWTGSNMTTGYTMPAYIGTWLASGTALKQGGELRFHTQSDNTAGAIERVRIDSSGNLLVGTTTTPGAGSATTGVGLLPGGAITAQRGGATACYFGRSNDGEVVALYSGTTQRGTISISGATTTYGSVSDYRLKENVVAISSGLSKVMALKPSTFNFIEFPDKNINGFIAHEVAEVEPIAVTGKKDAVDEDGKLIFQSVDAAKLVPLLTAAIQEQQALITQLQADVAALKG